MDEAAAEDPSQQTAFWRRLLHRWLIQYNPLYLLSAALVLAGVILAAHFVFRELTCRHCGNNCVGNCNPRYLEWKVARQQQGR